MGLTSANPIGCPHMIFESVMKRATLVWALLRLKLQDMKVNILHISLISYYQLTQKQILEMIMIHKYLLIF